MRNPLRSETDAFRFVLLTIGYFALIVIGSLIQVWVGVAVFVLLTAGALWFVLRSRTAERPVAHVPAPSPPDEHRVLVIANETVGGPELLAELSGRAGGRRVVVLVVAPALVTPLEQWTNDDGDARAAAQARLDQSVESMRAAGLTASGEIGDADPVQAAEDAVRTFRPDEIVLSTHPEGRSSWLEQGVVDKVRERFAVPLTHVVVDLDADHR